MTCDNKNCSKGIIRIHNVFMLCPVCSPANLEQPPLTLDNTDTESLDGEPEDAV